MWRLRPDALTVLNDESARRSLARYFAVMQNQKTAKFMIAKRIAADFTPVESTGELWQKHIDLTRVFRHIQRKDDSVKSTLEKMKVPNKSYLDLKVEIANRILSNCHFCERRCSVNRLKGERGYCKCGEAITVSTIFEHVGEEPELVPSGTVFTLGCTMACKHCPNWIISQWLGGGRGSINT